MPLAIYFNSIKIIKRVYHMARPIYTLENNEMEIMNLFVTLLMMTIM